MRTSTITTNTPPRAPTMAKSVVEALEEESAMGAFDSSALGVFDSSDGSVTFKKRHNLYVLTENVFV